MKSTTPALICVACLAGLTAEAFDPSRPRPTSRRRRSRLPNCSRRPRSKVRTTRVASAVETEGYFHEFHIQSDFGAFDAAGRTSLAVRLREIEALAQLEDVSKTEVFLKAAGTSVLNVGKGVATAVTKPTETAKGIGSGVKRFG